VTRSCLNWVTSSEWVRNYTFGRPGLDHGHLGFRVRQPLDSARRDGLERRTCFDGGSPQGPVVGQRSVVNSAVRVPHRPGLALHAEAFPGQGLARFCRTRSALAAIPCGWMISCEWPGSMRLIGRYRLEFPLVPLMGHRCSRAFRERQEAVWGGEVPQ